MVDEQFEITTADMLEIVAGGGNGSEYVDIVGLIETAAKELREKDAGISELKTKVEQLEGKLKWQTGIISMYDTALKDARKFIAAIMEKLGHKHKIEEACCDFDYLLQGKYKGH